MTGLHIQGLDLAGKNKQGSTYELLSDRSGDFIIGYRNEGTVSGRHYHEGKAAQKAPEVLLLLTGRIALFARHLETEEEVRTTINAPCRIEIHPFVWHELHALSDISFVELNSLEAHAADTQREVKAKSVAR